MLGPTLQRYGFELVRQPARLRNLVEHRCRKAGELPPEASYWEPLELGWLAGWPERATSEFGKRYHQLRYGIAQQLQLQGLDSWLMLLPPCASMSSSRADLEVGRGAGQQPNLAEALARVAWKGKVELSTTQSWPRAQREGELHLVAEQAGLELHLEGLSWQQGWLILEGLVLQGPLRLQGGLLELRRCRLASDCHLQVEAAGALLRLEDCEVEGQVSCCEQGCLEVLQSSFAGSAVGITGLGQVVLRGVALSQHPQAALRLGRRARALVEDCQLSSSGSGLQVSGEARVHLSHSWFRSNHNYGLAAREQACLSLNQCHFLSNGRDGLRLADSVQVQLEGCQTRDNTGAGVRRAAGVNLACRDHRAGGNGLGDLLEEA